MRRPGTCLVAGACLLALTSAARADPPETIALTFPPDLAPDVEALPRLLATRAAMTRINARLEDWTATCGALPWTAIPTHRDPLSNDRSMWCFLDPCSFRS